MNNKEQVNKSETIHIRVSPDIKKESEIIFEKLGITTSYAVSMFLKQVIYKNGIPFDIVLPSEEEQERYVQLANIINMTGGKEISSELNEIVNLYAKKKISYDTACLIIERSFI